jgi:hypothetical protein
VHAVHKSNKPEQAENVARHPTHARRHLIVHASFTAVTSNWKQKGRSRQTSVFAIVGNGAVGGQGHR